MVRDDMLGFAKTIPVRKIAKRFGVEPEEIELSLEALQYLILHIAKTNSVSIEDFSSVYESTGLRMDLGGALYNIVKGHIVELRKILDNENEVGRLLLTNVDWRLSLVSGCRQKLKMMVPKYTMQLEFEQKKEAIQGATSEQSSMVFDLDYVTMKRL